jgi:hypothetical protein
VLASCSGGRGSPLRRGFKVPSDRIGGAPTVEGVPAEADPRGRSRRRRLSAILLRITCFGVTGGTTARLQYAMSSCKPTRTLGSIAGSEAPLGQPSAYAATGTGIARRNSRSSEGLAGEGDMGRTRPASAAVDVGYSAGTVRPIAIRRRAAEKN